MRGRVGGKVEFTFESQLDVGLGHSQLLACCDSTPHLNPNTEWPAAQASNSIRAGCSATQRARHGGNRPERSVAAHGGPAGAAESPGVVGDLGMERRGEKKVNWDWS